MAKEGRARTKNELIEDLSRVSVADIPIGRTTAMECLGVVETVMESVVIAKANTNGEYQVLDEGVVVVDAARRIVGKVIYIVYYEDLISRSLRPLAQ